MPDMLTKDSSRSKKTTRLLIIFLIVILSAWLLLTPAGLDGKLHAVGYSVCHQIDSHSFTIGSKVLPLCARCTGTFLGLLVSILYLSSKKKAAGVPSRLKIALLSVFFLFFAVDGINSSLTFLPGLQPLYPPSNYTRLASGLLFGVALANLVIPLWHQTLWKEGSSQAALSNWKQLGWLVLFAATIFLLVIADVTILYYPIAVLSILSIIMILSMVYSLLWCIILKKENSLHRFSEGIRIFIAGVITALIQVGLMDLIRHTLSGTW